MMPQLIDEEIARGKTPEAAIVGDIPGREFRMCRNDIDLFLRFIHVK
jgi:hypothetical protein